MASCTTIQITITNWEKFNPRKDLRATSWLRFQNSIFEDAQFFEFSHAEICFWIYILCQASRKQSGQIIVNIAHAKRIGRFSEAEILSAIKKLNEINCVTESHADVTSTSHEQHAHDTLRTNATTRDERNETNEHNAAGANFGDVQKLISEWGITLKHFKISKDPKFDDSSIMNLATRHGFEKTRLALIGQRFEQKTQTFDPSKHISIVRFKSNPAHFEKMVNLGSQEQSSTTTTGTWVPPELRGNHEA